MDKLTELNLPIFSFIIHMMCEKVLKYLQSFFKKFSEGCRDYAQMLPGQRNYSAGWSIVFLRPPVIC